MCCFQQAPGRETKLLGQDKASPLAQEQKEAVRCICQRGRAEASCVESGMSLGSPGKAYPEFKAWVHGGFEQEEMTLRGSHVVFLAGVGVKETFGVLSGGWGWQ